MARAATLRRKSKAATIPARRKFVLPERPTAAEIDAFIGTMGGKPMTRKTAAALKAASVGS